MPQPRAAWESALKEHKSKSRILSPGSCRQTTCQGVCFPTGNKQPLQGDSGVCNFPQFILGNNQDLWSAQLFLGWQPVCRYTGKCTGSNSPNYQGTSSLRGRFSVSQHLPHSLTKCSLLYYGLKCSISV